MRTKRRQRRPRKVARSRLRRARRPRAGSTQRGEATTSYPPAAAAAAAARVAAGGERAACRLRPGPSTGRGPRCGRRRFLLVLLRLVVLEVVEVLEEALARGGVGEGGAVLDLKAHDLVRLEDLRTNVQVGEELEKVAVVDLHHHELACGNARQFGGGAAEGGHGTRAGDRHRKGPPPARPNRLHVHLKGELGGTPFLGQGERDGEVRVEGLAHAPAVGARHGALEQPAAQVHQQRVVPLLVGGPRLGRHLRVRPPQALRGGRQLLDFDAVYVFVEAVDQEVEQLLGVVLLVPLELGAEVPHQLLEAARGDH
mmetsp:Transcript_3613/g.8481  ORF Transcript_3613/g.8481 Transcript_3613/m.8481 type:complete len:312 (+) Transcript_3613:752-1687(+)